MMNNTTKPDSLQPSAEKAVDLFDNWLDPIETEVRARAREFIEELIRGELDAVLARPRYGRSQMAGKEESAGVAGHGHGSRTRSLTGTFGPVEIAVPRARLITPGQTAEWKSQALRAYQRRTLAADALVDGAESLPPGRSTAVTPIWAPRWRGSAAMVASVSAALRNRIA
jgi:putative transposase